MLYEAEFWLAVAFVLFVAILARVGVFRALIRSLDDRGRRVQSELDEARRLRDEAQALLVQYQRRRQEAEQEAEAIVRDARAEGERLQAEAKAKVEEFVASRTRMAEAKISQAEAQAIADVRSAAADAAVAAAEKILAEAVHGKVAAKLIDDSIGELKAKLN